MFKLNVSQLSHHDRPLKSEEENQPFLISTPFLSQSLSKNRDNGLASKSPKPSGRKLLEISISYLTSPDSCELFSKSLITLCLCVRVCLCAHTSLCLAVCLFCFFPPSKWEDVTNTACEQHAKWMIHNCSPLPSHPARGRADDNKLLTAG